MNMPEQDNLITILEDLIGMDTTTANLQGNIDALTWSQKHLEKNGIASQLLTYAQRPVLVWGQAPEKARILINTHIDVVPAPMEMFTPTRSEGQIFGRGASDTKPWVAVLLNLPQPLVEAATHNDVLFSLVSDEEVGGPSSKAFISDLPALEFGLFGEPSDLKMINQAKGVIAAVIKFPGKAAHGSRPWLGKNAIVEAAQQLTDFISHYPVPEQETEQTTFNFSLISGGTAINQIPAGCQLSCDIRFNPEQSSADVIDLLRSGFSSAQVDVLVNEPAINTAQTDRYVQMFSEALTKTGINPEFTFDHASSDARHCTRIGVPALMFGPSRYALHQLEEKVDIDTVYKTQDALRAFLKNL